MATFSEGELDVPLATLAADLVAGVSTREDVRGVDETVETVETHVGEAPPPLQEKDDKKDSQTEDVVSATDAQQTESPRFCAYLPDFERAFGSRTVSPTVKGGS